MIKKLIISLYLIFLIFTLTSCTQKEDDVTLLEKKDTITLELIDIDFELTNATLDELYFEFPTNDWELVETKDKNNELLLKSKNINLDIGTNIIFNTIDYYKQTNLQDYMEMQLKEMNKKEFPLECKIHLLDITNFNNMEIGYLEYSSKFTKERVENAVKNGILTEEVDFKEIETLINFPEAKKIQIIFKHNDDFFSIQGTYKNEEEEEIVLKALKTILQTIKFS